MEIAGTAASQSQTNASPHKAIYGAELLDKVVDIDQSPIGERRVRILPPIPVHYPDQRMVMDCQKQSARIPPVVFL